MTIEILTIAYTVLIVSTIILLSMARAIPIIGRDAYHSYIIISMVTIVVFYWVIRAIAL